MEPPESMGAVLEPYRQYLHLLASLHLDGPLRGRVEPADIVQQTFLRACTTFDTLRSREPGVVAAWLRTILARTLADNLRDMERARRDFHRERSLEAALEQSSSELAGLLAADQSSPSEKAVLNEQLLDLAEALTVLPDDMRRAVVAKHCQGKSLLEIAEIMDRTPASVAGLLRRGLQVLRDRLRLPEEERP
jgi:RNA polymerase sigma-70 factor (ECF subfamily)